MCAICGKNILHKNTGRKRKYCSLECKKANLTQAMKKPGRTYKQKKFKEKYQKNSTGKTIDKLATEDKKLGMDYGNYTAMLRGKLKR
nr:MAG TPA: DNA gyrase inhibitor [Caudoviricetes sp.]